MATTPKNLSLDDNAIKRGERYSKLHGTNLSRLVSDYLNRLPLAPAEVPTSTAVLRLRGVAASKRDGKAAYHRHLSRKYGKG